MATTQSCSNDLDALFGPRVNTCLRALDFTLLFETIFLCIVPTGIFLFLATHELRSLFARESRVRSGLLHLVKLLGIAILLALDLVVFAYQFKREYTTSERLSDTYAVGAALSLGSTVVLGVLSHFEHIRSIQPSTLIISFLLVTIIFDIVRCRTLWLLGISSPLPALFTASLVAKLFVFIFETRGKKAYLPSEDQKLSPEELSSSWGQSLYLWLNGLLILGYKNILLPEQLYPMDSGMVSERIAENYRTGWRKARAEASVGEESRWLIYKVAIQELGWAFWYPVLPRLILMAFTFAQPFLVNTILIYLTSDEDVSSGYGLIIAFGLTYIGLSVSQSWYWYRIYRLSVMARAGLISLIYEQSLLVSSEKVDDSMALNLMGQAVDRIMLASAQVHELWATPMAVVIGVWLLSREIGYGWATLLVLSTISSVIAYFLASSMGSMQKKWLAAIQVRVHEISNMLGSMKAVKLLGLENLLRTKIDALRHDDLTAAAQFRKILMWVVGNSHITPSLGPLAVVATYLASGATSLNTTVIFTVLTLLGLLTNPLGQLLSSLATYSAAMSCMDRIQAYLLVEKRVDYREFLEPIGSPLSSMKGSFDEKAWDSKEISVTSSSIRPMITIRDGSFKWKNGDFMVRNIDLTVQAGQKLAVLGRIGSGKSTLLRSILGETNLESGYIALASKRVAYCDQNVWLINGTLQQNIVSECPFDETWYAKIIECCALAQDIAHFEDGDAVKIGSGGVKLSGGQKQRIALARALYAKPEILLLDDPFSGLDRITESLIFSRVFIDGALLSQLGVATVLVTHGVRRAKFADEVVILGPTGRIVERGTYDQLTREGEYLRSLEADEEEDHAEKEREAQVDANARENDSSRPIAAPTKSELKIELPEERLQSPKKIDRTVYKTYVNAAGKINFLIFFICEVITCVFLTFPSIWLSHWSGSSADYQETHLSLLTGILAFGSVLGVLGLLGCVYYLFLGMAYRSGESLHAKMTVAVTTSAYSYISRIDTGSLVNRFSEDIMYLDSVLPLNIVNATLDSMSVLVQVGIISAVSVWMIVALPLLFACVYIVQHYYLRTSKQLRLLDIELKAPLFTQAIETSNGLASIRAFGMQDGLLAKNLQLLDASQKPVYLLFCVQRWLQLILGLMIAGLGILVIGIAVGLRGKTNAGSVGLAMVNITVLSEVLEYAIVHYTSLETSLGAVARIADFLKTTPTEKQERPLEKVSPLWAKRGAIDFKNVTARYEYSREPILQNITMSIKAGMKVGLCGRTGSGKSSLVALLVRLLDAESGDLFVDSVALSTMPRDKVRTRINVIPQEPFFFGGTIRENLVPLYEDSGLSASENENYRIVELLTKVGLWDKIAAQPGGLDAPLKSENFSFGERQLLCLIRAVLRRRFSNILILDEAMSNVDFETDLLMQRLVAEEFKRHTVISIVHRLDYAMSFDVIAVLDHGRLVEFDRAATVIGRHELFKGLRAELEEDSETEEE